MHITFWFSPLGKGDRPFIRLPRANLHAVSGMLYGLLPPERAAQAHDEGNSVDGRSMKLFAVSWLMAAAPPTFEEKLMQFPAPVRLVVSTPLSLIWGGLVDGALNRDEIRLGNNLIRCDGAETEQQVAEQNMIIRTLSPITCYRTEPADPRAPKHYTHYVSPGDFEFGDLLNSNLLRKFRALYPGQSVPSGIVKLTPLGTPRERVSLYEPKSKFPIKGWSGRFRIEGPRELLQVALDCGLGAGNSRGWGCVSKEE